MVGRRALASCALFLAAAGWFALGVRAPLELPDTGMILYPSWMVARGAVPYRDFAHMFGPSLFYANAAVFRLLGDDLMAMRLWVVVLRATVALLVFLLARRAARLPFALGAWVVVVATWGTPWWLFNAPYANHYGLLLLLAGLWAILALGRRALLGAALAGVCFGLASTFKQTSGVFGALAVALFLVLHGAPGGGGGPASRFERVLRGGILVAVLALFGAYLAPAGTPWTIAALAGPGTALVAWLGGRLWRGSSPAGPTLPWLVAVGAGMALPLLGYGIYFAALGLLEPLRVSLMDVPRALEWYVGIAAPQPSSLLLGAAVAALLIAVRPAAGAWRWPAGVVAVAVGGAAIATGAASMSGLAGLLPFVPVATAWGGVVAVVREPAGSRSRDLFTCFAVVSLLFLYPSADFWHVLMGLPAFLPLLAHLADRWVGRPQSFSTADRSRVAIAAAVATALLLATCTPFVAALAHARRAPTVPGLARAPGIADPSPEFRNIVALLAWLDRVPPERPLAVLVNRQLLYLLADRSSALASGEFVLYGIGFDVLPAERARALLPPAYVTERLDEARPVVIEREDGGAQRFRRIYPEAARQLDEHYAEVARFGPYRVLDRTD